MLEKNKIYLGDCLELMKEIPDKSIDMILTDIPYNEANRKSNGLRNLDKDKADICEFSLSTFLLESNRICKGSFYIFCGFQQLSEIDSFFRNNGVWTQEKKAVNDPIGDLLDATTTMADQYGVTLTRALMTTKTLRDMLASESIKKFMNPLAAPNMLVSSAQAKSFVSQETQLEIITYDKMFKDEQGVDHKFYPDGYVTLLPSYSLGNTWFGTTPEEYDLMSGNSSASVSVVANGVAITTVKEPHPVNVFTVVDAIMLPSFERMDDIYVMKVQ